MTRNLFFKSIFAGISSTLACFGIAKSKQDPFAPLDLDFFVWQWPEDDGPVERVSWGYEQIATLRVLACPAVWLARGIDDGENPLHNRLTGGFLYHSTRDPLRIIVERGVEVSDATCDNLIRFGYIQPSSGRACYEISPKGLDFIARWARKVYGPLKSFYPSKDAQKLAEIQEFPDLDWTGKWLNSPNRWPRLPDGSSPSSPY